MNDPIPGLQRLLAFHLKGVQDWPLAGNDPAYQQVMFLSAMVRDWSDGEYTIEELQGFFKNSPVPGFDILSWIKSKEADGTYWTDEEQLRLEI